MSGCIWRWMHCIGIQKDNFEGMIIVVFFFFHSWNWTGNLKKRPFCRNACTETVIVSDFGDSYRILTSLRACFFKIKCRKINWKALFSLQFVAPISVVYRLFSHLDQPNSCPSKYTSFSKHYCYFVFNLYFCSFDNKDSFSLLHEYQKFQI